MSDLKKGDRVIFLRETGGGIIKEVRPSGVYLVADEDGFDRLYNRSDIGPVLNLDYEIKLKETEETTVKPKVKAKKVPFEIDLHIEELVDNHSNMTNAEIIMKQVFALRSFYNRAKANKLRKLVIIHGVGEGVLRHEVRSFLDGKSEVEYYDADYHIYGYGATAVIIRYNY